MINHREDLVGTHKRMRFQHSVQTASITDQDGGTTGDLWIRILPYLALVLIHALFGMKMEQPTIMADELGYLGIARYLSNVAHIPDLRESTFYHFGYSLFLLPAYWLFSDPLLTYKAAIFINALLTSTLYLALYYILSVFFALSRKVALVISFTTCLYPAYMMQANIAWSENAFIPFYAILIATFGLYIKYRSFRYAVLFGFVTAFLYAIHPRALPILPIVVIFLLFLAGLKILPMIKTLMSISMIGCLFIMTRLIINHLKAAGWGNAGEFSSITLASRLLPSAELKNLLLRALGQILYLCQATYGLFLIGTIWMCWYIGKKIAATTLRKAIHDEEVLILLFVLFTSFGIFTASSTLKLYGIGGDDYIYGRYNEGFLAIYISFALMGLFIVKLDTRQLLYGILSVAAVILVSTLLIMIESSPALLVANVNAVNVFGIYPFFRTIGTLNLYTISLLTLMLFIIIVWILRRSYRAGIILLIFLFSTVSIYNYKIVLLPSQKNTIKMTSLASHILRLDPIKELDYDMAFYDPTTLYGYQYLLQDISFNRFNSIKKERPQSTVVISGNDWLDGHRLGAQFIRSENEIDQALWILPGGIQSRLPRRSYSDIRLGATKIPGVWESGFHGQEWIGNAPVRWSNGSAKLKIPIGSQHSLEALKVDIVSAGHDGTRLRVLVNKRELFNEKIPPDGWSQTFSLSTVPLEKHLIIELISGTFIPKERIKGSIDERTLGVMVKGIVLKGSPSMASRPLSNSGYRSLLKLKRISRYLSIASGQSIPLTVTVRNMGDDIWRGLYDLEKGDGSINLGIVWFDKNQMGLPLAEHRAFLPKAMFPSDEIDIKFDLKPAGSDGTALPPGNYKVLIGLVHDGITWFYEKEDKVLRLNVVVKD